MLLMAFSLYFLSQESRAKCISFEGFHCVFLSLVGVNLARDFRSVVFPRSLPAFLAGP